MKKKRCTGCEKRKSYNEFSKNKHGKFGLQSRCKPCLSDEAARRYAARVGKPVKKPNLESWLPLPGDKFDAYLGMNKCVLGPFNCVNNGPDKVTASTEDGGTKSFWGLDKAAFVFLKAS